MLSIVGSLLLALAIGAPFQGADIQVTPHSDSYTLVRATTVAEGTGYAWFVMGPQGLADAQTYNGGKGVAFTGPPGRYAVLLVISNEKGQLDQAQTIVIIGDPIPVPPVPTPTPTPTPTPNPPNPPGPTVPLAGMRVLIIEDESSRGVIPRTQLAALTSSKARTYLKSHNIPARQWDSKLSAANEAKEWQDLMARPHPTLPWVVVAGSSGVAFEGPLPADEAGLLALVQKYGGP